MTTEVRLEGEDIQDEEVQKAIAQADGNLVTVSVQSAPNVTVDAFEGLLANTKLESVDVSGCTGLFGPSDSNADSQVAEDEMQDKLCAFVEHLPETESGIVLTLADCFGTPTRPGLSGDAGRKVVGVPWISARTLWRYKIKRIDLGPFLCSGSHCAFQNMGLVQCDYDTSGKDIAAFCSDRFCAHQCIACKARYSPDYAYKQTLCRSCEAFWCGGRFCPGGDPRLELFESKEETREKGIFDFQYEDDGHHGWLEHGIDPYSGKYYGLKRCRCCSFLAEKNELERQALKDRIMDMGFAHSFEDDDD